MNILLEIALIILVIDVIILILAYRGDGGGLNGKKV